jgi:hypothetical protein
MAVSSSLSSIQIQPRTPKTPRLEDGAEEEVELRLLGEHERRQSQDEYDGNGIPETEEPAKPHVISAKDKRNMVLLCVLCKCKLL